MARTVEERAALVDWPGEETRAELGGRILAEGVIRWIAANTAPPKES